MTRHVFDSAMVAHIWAQGTQSNGRNSAMRVFFEGPNLFSYGQHFLTGYRLPNGDALINSAKYSISTSRHQQDARQAVTGQIIQIPGILMGNGSSRAYGTRYPLPDFMESRIFAIPQYVNRAGEVIDSAYDSEGNHIACGRANPPTRMATKAEMKKARVDLLKLFLDCEQMAHGHAIFAVFKHAGADIIEAEKAAHKVAEVHEKRDVVDAIKAKKALSEKHAKWAKDFTSRPISSFHAKVEEIRREVYVKAWHGAWESHARHLLQTAKDMFAARKEAKARGWIKAVVALYEREKILRAGAARLEKDSHNSVRYNRFSNHVSFIHDAITAVKSDADRDSKFWGEAERSADAIHAEMGYDPTAPGFSPLKKYFRISSGDIDSIAQKLKALEVFFNSQKVKVHKEEVAADLAKKAEKIEAWRNGSGALPGHLSDTENGALIRAIGYGIDDSGTVTGGRLTTSWGAEVPLPEAIKAFRFLKLCRDNGQAWHANGHVLEVGHFRVDWVDENGNFKAGCHRINWGEVSALAARLGLSRLAPADTTKERANA